MFPRLSPIKPFDPDTARHYVDNGANFILVGADVALLARGSEALAAQCIKPTGVGTPASY